MDLRGAVARLSTRLRAAPSASRITFDPAPDPPDGTPFGTRLLVERDLRMRELGLEASEPVAHPPRGAGLDGAGHRAARPVEWGQALERCVPERAILRPDYGPFGFRLAKLARDRDAVVDHAGRRTAPWELAQILTDPAVPHGWLLERRDRDDLAMLELAGGPLPTVVAVTWLDGDDARVAWLGVRGAPVGDDPRALATLVRPPDAAAALPQWESVSRLLARAARARALPAPAVGWDVLVTSEGPRIADCWNPRGSWHRRDAATRLDAAVVLAERTGGPVGWPLG